MMTDLRLAFRMLIKSPGFSMVAVLTLAVGIASATVVFSAIKTVLMNPLPMARDQKALLYMTQVVPSRGYTDMGTCIDDFLDLRRQMTTLAGIWTHSDRTIIINGTKSEPERLLGTDLSAGAFETLGIKPLLGRDLAAHDNEYDAPNVALLSYAVWQRRFGGDPAVVDTSIPLNGKPTTIVGVMPKGVSYPQRTDIWLPQRFDPNERSRGNYGVVAYARLKPGVTLAQAQAEADVIMRALAKEYPLTNNGVGVRFKHLRAHAGGDATHLLILLFGAVMFVFLIACLNVANLQLARAGDRSREFALRLALGAERFRLIRQLLTESLLLALLGGASGLILSLWSMDLVLAAIPVDPPHWLRFESDWMVFAFVLFLAGVSAAIFGLVLVFRATQTNLIDEIKEGGRTGALASRRRSRLHHTLVVAEIAIALILLVGAGLMMRSFLRLNQVEPGFTSKNVLTFRTGFPMGMGADREKITEFFSHLLSRLEALPGVESAAATSVLSGVDGEMRPFLMEGVVEPAPYSDALILHTRNVTPRFFETMKIPLLAGRDFDGTDRIQSTPAITENGDTKKPGARSGAGTEAIHTAGYSAGSSPRVCIVDQLFARTHFQSPENAIGKTIRMIEKHGELATKLAIVGVVAPVRQRLDQDEVKPTIYISHGQNPSNFMSVVMRTKTDPASYIALAQAEVLKVNRGIPIYYAVPLDFVLLQTIWTRQFFTYLFTVFAAIALFLACIGIYGVMSYSVNQRTQEIGVRMALGAQPGEVIRMVVGQGLQLVSYGLVCGIIGAAITVQFFTGILYGVSPHDPPTFTVVPIILGVVAIAACYVPSRRATRIDPTVALRAD